MSELQNNIEIRHSSLKIENMRQSRLVLDKRLSEWRSYDI